MSTESSSQLYTNLLEREPFLDLYIVDTIYEMGLLPYVLKKVERRITARERREEMERSRKRV